jgi:hypothetical protein
VMGVCERIGDDTGMGSRGENKTEKQGCGAVVETDKRY